MSHITKLRIAVATLGFAIAGVPAGAQEAPPAALLGDFADDYGNTYSVTAKEWRQGAAGGVYHIIAWHPRERYMIVHNAPENTSHPDRYSRIDWVTFADQPEYSWGFCYSAYKEATPEAAEAKGKVDRAAPKTGCNGFPFSRMKSRTPTSG